MLKPGAQIGAFVLQGPKGLGEGSFGEVWRVLDTETGQICAVKFVSIEDSPQGSDVVAAFHKEAEVWRSAGEHPNVQSLIRSDLYEGYLCLVSEVADECLQRWLERHQRKAPSLESALRMMIGVLNGLEHLHDVAKILHRDLKPGNILLYGEVPRIADFGEARLQTQGLYKSRMLAGTLYYSAPETLAGNYVQETDIWAVGVMLYEMLLGILPFPYSDARAVMSAIASKPPVEALPETLPQELRELILHCLEKKAEDRPHEAKGVRERLEAILDSLLPLCISEIVHNHSDGSEMAWLPGGEFLMGSSETELARLAQVSPFGAKQREAEAPQRRVCVSGFWIGKRPITVAQYEAFCGATRRQMPPPPFYNQAWQNKDHPITQVSWHDAMAYCEWAGLDLPTEAEWEYAARGGREDQRYPWGDHFQHNKLHCSRVTFGDARGTALAGRYPPNRFGLFDMSGNVLEWCRDWYRRETYQRDTDTNPQGGETGTERVLRGGSWFSFAPENFRCAYRASANPARNDANVGFRPVLRQEPANGDAHLTNPKHGSENRRMT